MHCTYGKVVTYLMYSTRYISIFIYKSHHEPSSNRRRASGEALAVSRHAEHPSPFPFGSSGRAKSDESCHALPFARTSPAPRQTNNKVRPPLSRDSGGGACGGRPKGGTGGGDDRDPGRRIYCTGRPLTMLRVPCPSFFQALSFSLWHARPPGCVVRRTHHQRWGGNMMQLTVSQ